MNAKPLNFLLALKALNNKVEIIREGSFSSVFLRVLKPFVVYKKVDIAKFSYKQTCIQLQTLPDTIFHMTKYWGGDANWSKWDGNKLRFSALFYPEYNQQKKKNNIHFSEHDPTFQYTPGELIVPKKRFSQYSDTCASGIHAFLTLKEAQDYIS